MTKSLEEVADWYTSRGTLYSVCPKCGGNISKEERTCIDCDNDPFALCRFCNEWIPANSLECPECGRSQKDIITEENEAEKSRSTSSSSISKHSIFGVFALFGILSIIVGAVLSSMFSIFLYLIGGLSLSIGVLMFVLLGLVGVIKGNTGSGETETNDPNPKFITDMKNTEEKISTYNGTNKGFKQEIKEEIAEADPDELIAAGKFVASTGQTAVEKYQNRREKIETMNQARSEADEAIETAETFLQQEQYLDDGIQKDIESSIENVEHKLEDDDATAEEIESAINALLKNINNKESEIIRKSYENKIESKGDTIWKADCQTTNCIKLGRIKYSTGITSTETEDVGFTIIDRTEMPFSSDKLTLQCVECSQTMEISAEELGE